MTESSPHDDGLRVDVVGTVGVPARYGGFETLVENLLENWERNAVPLRATVYCSSRRYTERPSSYRGARLVYIPLDANGAQSIPYDILSLLRSAFSRTDVLLVLGVSGALALPIARLCGKRIVTNIDGLEWRRDKWGLFAKALLKGFERIAVRVSHEIISDNAAIQSYVREEYGRDSVLIPYGGDHAALAPVGGAHPDIASLISLPDRPYAVKVCRIEPENNVHMILEAFADSDGLPLVIVGNWEASAYGRDLKARYKDADAITISDPIYDPRALFTIRGGAAAYVHGHSAGGTNPSLVEAMSLGLPVIAFACGYNEATTDNSALYFRNSEELRSLLAAMTDDARAEIGAAMRRIAGERYTWDVVAGQYTALLRHGHVAAADA